VSTPVLETKLFAPAKRAEIRASLAEARYIDPSEGCVELFDHERGQGDDR